MSGKVRSLIASAEERQEALLEGGKFKREANRGASRGFSKVYIPRPALPPVSSLTLAGRRRKETGDRVYACLLLFASILLLLVALCSEAAIFYAVGTAVRMFYIDSPAQQYDGARLDRRQGQ